MPEHLISDRPRFGRDTLLWRDSDQVWSTTKPTLTHYPQMMHFEATKPEAPGDMYVLRCVVPVRRRTFWQRVDEAWRAFRGE